MFAIIVLFALFAIICQHTAKAAPQFVGYGNGYGRGFGNFGPGYGGYRPGFGSYGGYGQNYGGYYGQGIGTPIGFGIGPFGFLG